MRMAFGLVSVLVTLAIILYMVKEFELPEVEEGHQLQQQVQLFSGRDANNVPIEQTYKLYPDYDSSTRLVDFQVQQENVDSPLLTVCGVKTNDVILGTIDSHGLTHDFAKDGEDEQMCKYDVRDVVAQGGKIIVLRGTQRLQLPPDGHQPFSTPPPTNQPAAQNQPQPAAAPQGSPNGHSQDDAMDQIKQRLHTLPGY